jgi:hypothetical protein
MDARVSKGVVGSSLGSVARVFREAEVLVNRDSQNICVRIRQYRRGTGEQIHNIYPSSRRKTIVCLW